MITKEGLAENLPYFSKINLRKLDKKKKWESLKSISNTETVSENYDLKNQENKNKKQRPALHCISIYVCICQ